MSKGTPKSFIVSWYYKRESFKIKRIVGIKLLGLVRPNPLPPMDRIKLDTALALVSKKMNEVMFTGNSYMHCIKYARIRIFTDSYIPVKGLNFRFCPYTGEYRSVKTSILTYFMQ